MGLPINKVALEWQRRLDPANFNKKTGAQYHTAPSVIMGDSPDIPKDAPEGSVTVMFFIDGECWLTTPERTVVDNPLFMEGKPKTKRAKHGPVFVLSETQALCAIPVSQNYYWTAQVMCSQEVFRAVFIPDKTSTKQAKVPKVKAVVTFVPKD